MNQPPSELERKMRRATEAAAKGDGSTIELESAARALVLELREANHPPEQMLMRIKEILAESGLRPAYASTDAGAPPRSESAIYRSVIEWSIRQYYDIRDGNGDGPGHGATS